ncbi:MAG TPA: lipopolysaccharide biosynthesis protein [Bryobacteraceae bacterium]|nr:lipopolysaccharide biosynthesis protein [Bryobacteraceae bacterium]
MSVNGSLTVQLGPPAFDGRGKFGAACTFSAKAFNPESATPAGEAQAAPTRLSLRSNFAWALAGNAGYAACQWGMIVVLAKLGNSFLVGQFSLGLAIATPVLMFANLHLRAMQATDARRQYGFYEYRRLRIATTLVAMAAIAMVARFGTHNQRALPVILAVAAAKSMEALSDIYYGLFQLNDRLDQIGQSMILRGAASLAALSAAFYLTRNLFWGCFGMAAVSLGSLLLFDCRRRDYLPRPEAPSRISIRSRWLNRPARTAALRRQWGLIWSALPLGVMTTLASINLNLPRYFIHAWLGEHQLGIFSALAYATVAITLVSDSMSNCIIPRMSRLYAGEQIAEFRSVLLAMLGLAAALGLAGLLAANLMGARLLALVYGPEYAAQARVFQWLMLATALQCVASGLTSGIMSARRFRIQATMSAAMVGANALACAVWIPTAGLEGGAMAMVAAAAVRLTLAAAVAGRLVWNPSKAGAESAPCLEGWRPEL